MPRRETSPRRDTAVEMVRPVAPDNMDHGFSWACRNVRYAVTIMGFLAVTGGLPSRSLARSEVATAFAYARRVRHVR